MLLLATSMLPNQLAVSPAKIKPIPPITVLCAPFFALTSDIPSSDPVSLIAQNICNAPPVAPEATPHKALQTLPKHNNGKNHPLNCVASSEGANISSVMPMSTIISAKYFHLLMFRLSSVVVENMLVIQSNSCSFRV
jgi:hypothetical protein